MGNTITSRTKRRAMKIDLNRTMESRRKTLINQNLFQLIENKKNMKPAK